MFGFGKKAEEKVIDTSTTLNLQKGGILNLSKTSSLEHIRMAGGWDINSRGGADYELDLMCQINYSNDRKKLVYFGNKVENGISLDKDNLTGEGDGDDENIDIYFNKLDPNVEHLDIYVIIYQGKERHQTFGEVENAYVRVIDEKANKELCRYDLSKDGNSSYSIKAGTFYKENGEWAFRAIGEYGKLSGGNLLG